MGVGGRRRWRRRERSSLSPGRNSETSVDHVGVMAVNVHFLLHNSLTVHKERKAFNVTDNMVK